MARIWKPRMGKYAQHTEDRAHPMRHTGSVRNPQYKKVIQNMEIDAKIKKAFEKVDRRHFVADPKLRIELDRAHPTHEGQTTSQPSLMAFMLHVTELKKGDDLAEIGSGSGFLLAVGHEITKKSVHGFEIKPKLVRFSEQNTRKQYPNENHAKNNFKLTKVSSDKTFKKYENKFDVVVVSAGLELKEMEEIPSTLEELDELIKSNNKIHTFADMLKDGGRLCIPIGKHIMGGIHGKLCFFELRNNILYPIYIENHYPVEFVKLI